jgi:hypothetical protein
MQEVEDLVAEGHVEPVPAGRDGLAHLEGQRARAGEPAGVGDRPAAGS